MRDFRYNIRRLLFSGFLFFQDLLLYSLAVTFAFWLRFDINLSGVSEMSSPDPPSYWFAFFSSIYIVMAQLAASGLYSLDYLRTWRDDLYDITRSVSVAGLLLLSVSFFYRKIEFSRQVVLTAWPLAILAVNLGRIVVRVTHKFFRDRGFFFRKALIVGSGSMVPIILDKLTVQNPLGLRAVGFVDDRMPTAGKNALLPYFGPRETIREVLRSERIRVVFFVDDAPNHSELLTLIEICEGEGVELLLVPQVQDLLINYSGLRELDGLPLVELREEPVRWGSLLIKRVLDFGVATTVLLATFPLQILIAAAICLDSPGHPLFFQMRVGYRGRKFLMWKFRTMIVDAEKQLDKVMDLKAMKEPVFKIQNDPRVTRVGKWLRRTSLDELPQLWNVFLGQMSLVGPRPEEEALVARYNVWQRRRLKIKPGITGLQQIKCRGSTSLSERVKYDIYYIRRMSVLWDIEILVRTIWVVLTQRGAH